MLKTLMFLPLLTAGVVPLIIISFTHFRFATPSEALFYLGWGIFFIGLSFVVAVTQLFLREGEKNPAPRAEIGSLILRGSYLYVRNPMLIGIIFMVLGESALLHSFWILGWAVCFFVFKNFYLQYYEEPRLAKEFGAKYLDYVRNVPRWIPRTTAWRDFQKS